MTRLTLTAWLAADDGIPLGAQNLSEYARQAAEIEEIEQ